MEAHAEKAKTTVCNIPHAHRRAGRYTFRRRVHFRNLISTPLSLALGTADPKVARNRAAILSARFVRVKSSVDAMLEDGQRLTGPEIEALFRAALEAELASYVHSAYENASWLSIGVQKGPPISVQKGPPSSSGVTGLAGVPFALVAA